MNSPLRSRTFLQLGLALSIYGARGAGVLLAGAACCQAAEAARQSFNLPAGDAADMLRQLSAVSGREILGEFTALEAGNRMLAGTSLHALQDERTGALAVRRREGAAPASRGSAAQPSAAAGTNGSGGDTPGAPRIGTLRGRVFNVATGQNLEGATVRVLGGRTAAVTERDGTFALPRLPAGLVTVKVSYPGLEDSTVAVELAPDGTATKDFPLTSGIYAMEAYAVTAVREGNAAAIARQENALTITNSVSTDAYGNVAKGDMGSFLQRLPGVVGEYGGSAVDAISVRGLSPEFTTVTMDGTRFAAANPDSRIQVVSGLPAGSIESVEVV
jgi:iron complex outermembrane receptor protein